jgi:hypothetical protein
MAAKKSSAKKAGRKVQSRPIKRFCPLLQGDCKGRLCAMFHRAKQKKYSRCAIAEIAQGVNSLSFRIRELGEADEEEWGEDVEAEDEG